MRIPVAPRLAHRAGLRRCRASAAVGVDDEPVREAVRVLVVDDVASSPPLTVRERVRRRRRAGIVEEVHLHPRRHAVGRRDMFALSVWSGPGVRTAPIDGSRRRPAPALQRVASPSNVAGGVVKPIGAAARWSWKLLTKKKTCMAFCLRFVSHEGGEPSPSPDPGKIVLSHEQGNAASHGELVWFVNAVNG